MDRLVGHPAQIDRLTLAGFGAQGSPLPRYVLDVPCRVVDGVEKAAGARTIVLYMPPGPGRPFVLVAFRNGGVAQMPWPSFEQMLKRQLDGGAKTEQLGPRNIRR